MKEEVEIDVTPWCRVKIIPTDNPSKSKLIVQMTDYYHVRVIRSEPMDGRITAILCKDSAGARQLKEDRWKGE